MTYKLNPKPVKDDDFVKQVLRAYKDYGVYGADRKFAELVLRHAPEDKGQIARLRQRCMDEIYTSKRSKK